MSDYSSKLLAIRDETDLLEIAEQEIEKRMRELLEAKIQTDYAALESEEEDDARQFDQDVVESGAALGHAVALMRNLGQPLYNLFGAAIGESYGKFSEQQQFQDCEDFFGAHSKGLGNMDFPNF